VVGTGSAGYTGRAAQLVAAAAAAPGFLPLEEGLALARAAERAARSALGPLLEIGSYLGRSTLLLAAGIVASGRDGVTCYSLDHHRGSEEMQAGWAHHDPSLVDPGTGRMDTLPGWRRRIEEAAVEDLVVGILGVSATVARDWSTPLGMVFVDGGHGEEVAWADYRGWGPKVAPGGLLVLHDVFPDPADGGRPPYECYLDAISSGTFTEDRGAGEGSLRVLVASGANSEPVATPPRSASAASSTAAAE